MTSNESTNDRMLNPSERASISPGSSVLVERPTYLKSASFRGGASRVGAFSYFNQGTTVYNANIGRFCSIAHNVMVGPVEHPVRWLSTHGFAFNDRGIFGGNEEFEDIVSSERPTAASPTLIGNDVWIGYGCFIRRGVTIGDGAIIAAQSTVLRDVPPYTIFGGSPARMIDNRFEPEMVTRLQKVSWWNYQLKRSILGDVKYSNVEESLSAIESAVSEGKLPPLKPELVRLEAGSAKRVVT